MISLCVCAAFILSMLLLCYYAFVGVCYRDSQIFETEYVKCHKCLFLSLCAKFGMYASSKLNDIIIEKLYEHRTTP